MMITHHKVFSTLVFLAFCCGFTGLFATQPFWSMEPSTQTIERADSLTGFDILKYDIDLRVDDQTHFIEGWIEATVLAENTLYAMDYELTGGSLTVNAVLVNGVVTTFTHQNGILHIPLFINAGSQFTTVVWYSGVPANSPAPYNIGLKFTPSGIYTLSNPDAGRYYWCSYDHPWDKALVDWHITVRSDWLAAANGIRTGITDNPDGTRTHHWVCASPVATYVMGFAAAPYVEFTQQAGNLPIQNFVLPGQFNNAQTDFANVPEMISYFSSIYGPYPFEKYGHMVVNMSTYAAMEHQTMTTFGSQYLDGQQTYESIVAHELTHQWYGNYLTPLTMREVWLKESFATYSEALWVAHHEGWDAACTYMTGEIQQYYLNWENSNGPHTIFNPEYNLMFAPPTYEKSASVLHMLRLKMGNDAFFNFIRALLTTYPNGNLVTSEFISLAQQHCGQNLTQFFDQWIYSPGIPNFKTWVFSNNAGQAKIYAQSTSPTETAFTLDIPLLIPGTASSDSLVVIATPETTVNYCNYNPANQIEGIQLDPHNWVITRQKELVRLSLVSCLPYNSAVSLSWAAFATNIPVIGYKVFRKQLPNGEYSCLNPEPINDLSWIDTGVANGQTYQYYVCAVDAEGFLSLPSNLLEATPIAFPFDSGFLVVDETRNGNGTAVSPDDNMVDAFYAAALEGLDYTQWDTSLQGLPQLADLSHYPLVFWHADDFSEMQLQDNLDLIGSYVLSGGKLLISGWKYPSVFTQGFLNQFLPGVTPVCYNSAVLVSLQSELYPDLYPDPNKLAAVWNGMLPMSYTFAGAGNTLYTAEMLNGGSGQGEPAAIRIEQNGTLILLGVPLYYMQAEGVHDFLQQVLPQLYPAVAVSDETAVPPAVSLSQYPNPFGRNGSLKLQLKGGKPLAIGLYNLKGQKVVSSSGFVVNTKGLSSEISLNPMELNKLSSGCYFLKLETESATLTRKLVYMK